MYNSYSIPLSAFSASFPSTRRIENYAACLGYHETPIVNKKHTVA